MKTCKEEHGCTCEQTGLFLPPGRSRNSHLPINMCQFLSGANAFAITALLLEQSQNKVTQLVLLQSYYLVHMSLSNLIELHFIFQGKLSTTHTHRLHLANLGLLMMVSALAILLHPTISTGIHNIDIIPTYVQDGYHVMNVIYLGNT